jgi:hypothetical protein
LEAIAIAQKECNTLAVYAFKLQRICRIFVQRTEIVVKAQLAAWSIKPTGKARHASLSVAKMNSRSFVQICRLFVLRHEGCGELLEEVAVGFPSSCHF